MRLVRVNKDFWLAAGLAVLLCGVGGSAGAQGRVGNEQRAVQAFERVRKNPLELRAWLEKMPKGADLHMHLSGAVYAETFLREAVADGLCVNVKTLSFSKPVSPMGPCIEGDVASASVFKDQKLYDGLVDSFSMRSFVPSAGVSGHDQFFATFARFSGLDNEHAGEWVDEVATRAARQNEQYLELMMTPPFGIAAALGYKYGWRGDSVADMSAMRDALLAGGLRAEVDVDRKQFAAAEAGRNAREKCGTPQAAAGCSVGVRWLVQILRGFAPQQVFAQVLLGFEVASVDPHVVGMNFVMPEDGYTSMSEYHRQMLMMDYLHSIYPKVHISLHAGEVAPGLVTPDGLRFHIREAIELGHAERIGHGVDVMYEERPQELLNEMAAKHVMVEVNITSNDVILGIKGAQHPLPIYRKAGVPVALSTDDEGVSRIDLTNEYERAALEFGLGYRDLKRMARTGIEHSFLPGASLWSVRDGFRAMSGGCSTATIAAPSAECKEFLQSSEKAQQSWELERRFAAFESGPMEKTQ